MEENRTLVTEFVFLGFPTCPELQIVLFLIFLIIYTLTLMENVIIICLVVFDHNLHKPMYFFISNFSAVDIGFTSTVVPKLLSDFLMEKKTISLTGCLTQLYLFFSLGAVECVFLAIMSFDRYMAICKPLHYTSVMNSRMCIILAIFCWATGFLWIVVPITFISQLTFCSPNVMNHFICDTSPLFALTCSRSSNTELICYTFTSILILSCCVLTSTSYIFIINTILNTPSTTGRQKAFSTCTSHLTVISIFYGSLIFMYVRSANAEAALDLDKVIALFYSVITPLINPLIYSLRNKDVTRALKKAMGGSQGLGRRQIL
ncbi:olfactory receptor 11H6-like [Rhinatrema bivittatum]|uniref:olfactory receptor 11H6-like n=1 Tax=Rhinatrema bivittatum TaxID=194408 RepID=UPI0011296D72|nr:olfactory receptor 11H6-like [Rhinatrema bivittatum]